VTALAVLAKPTGIILGPILSAYLLWKNAALLVKPGAGSRKRHRPGRWYFLYNFYRFGNYRTFGPPWMFPSASCRKVWRKRSSARERGLFLVLPLRGPGDRRVTRIRTRWLEAWDDRGAGGLLRVAPFVVSNLGARGWSWGPRHLLPSFRPCCVDRSTHRRLAQKQWWSPAYSASCSPLRRSSRSIRATLPRPNEQGISNEEMMWPPEPFAPASSMARGHSAIEDARHSDVREMVGQRTDVPAAKISNSRALRIVAYGGGCCRCATSRDGGECWRPWRWRSRGIWLLIRGQIPEICDGGSPGPIGRK